MSKIFVFLCISLMILTGCIGYVNNYFGLKDDNPVEEIIEGLIEREIGVDIDLTPTSKEP